jgi:hypothetical protein
VKWELGNVTEHMLLEHVAEVLTDDGWQTKRGERVMLTVTPAPHGGEVLFASLLPDHLDTDPVIADGKPQDIVVGHIDVTFTKENLSVVVDTKSTTFMRKKNEASGRMERAPDATPRYHYMLQTAAYTLGRGSQWFGDWVLCRESGMRNFTNTPTFWHHVDDDVSKLFPELCPAPVTWRQIVTRRVTEVLRLTGPGSPPPPCIPPADADTFRKNKTGRTKTGNWRVTFCKACDCPQSEKGEDLD